MNKHRVIDWHSRFGFGRPRPISQIRNVFIHTTENAYGTPAENVANYQLRKQNGSYHVLVDHEKLLIANTDDWLTWSTGNRGNDVGLHISLVAFAGSTRDQWMQRRPMLERAAWQVAKWCKKHNIPAIAVDGDGLLRGERGISTHAAARAWGSTDHWDPGPGFPMDVFIGMVKAEMEPKKSSGKGEAMTQFDKINTRYKSRVPGSQVTMRPIDALMNIDRHAWETRQKLDELSKKIDQILKDSEK